MHAITRKIANFTTARRMRYLSVRPQRGQRMANADIGCQQSLQWISVMASTDQHESALAPEPCIFPHYLPRIYLRRRAPI